jgi:PST family polysaccharide transporter
LGGFRAQDCSTREEERLMAVEPGLASPGPDSALGTRAARGVLWYGIQAVGTRLTSLAAVVVLAHLLRPADFGLVAYTMVFLAFATIFQDQGLGQALVQRQEIDREHVDTAFWMAVLSGSLLTGLTCLAAPALADLTDEPRLRGLLQVLSLTLVLGSLSSVPAALLQRDLRVRPLAVVSTVCSALAAGVAIVLAAMGAGVWALVAQSLIAPALIAPALAVASAFRPRPTVSWTHFRQLVGYGGHMVVLDLLNFVNRRGDDLLVGVFLGPVALGYYTLAYRLLLLMTDLLVSTVSTIMLPVVGRLQVDLARTRQAFYKVTQLGSAVAFPGFCFVLVAASPVVAVVYGGQWHASIPAVRLFMLIGLLHGLLYQFNPVFNGLGKPRITVAITAINAVANAAAFSIGLHWGFEGVAAAYVIRGFLTSPLHVWMGIKTFGLDTRTWVEQWRRPLTAAVVASGIAAAPVVGLRGHALLSLTSAATAFLVTYLFLLRTLRPDLVTEFGIYVRRALRTAG